MISRIFTGAALTGILLATGCGGGGGAGSHVSSAVPAIGGSAGASKGTGSFVASFNIPFSEARVGSASNRKPQYLSPGTTGLTILLGNGTTTTGGAVLQERRHLARPLRTRPGRALFLPWGRIRPSPS